MKTKAVVVEKQGSPMKFMELNVCEPRSNEVRIKMVSCGVCHTDVAQATGEWGMGTIKTPIVMGHEGAGIVESVGPGVTKVQVGDHVLISNPSCGNCEQCQKGNTTLCKELDSNSRLLLGGQDYFGGSPLTMDNGDLVWLFLQQSGFSEYVVTNISSITKVNKDMDLKVAGPLGCGLRTGSGAVYNVIKPRPEDWMVITGGGAVGLSAMWMANAMGAKTIVVDIADSRLEMAEKLGAYKTLNSRGLSEDQLAETLIEMTDGKGADSLIECTGVPMCIRGGMKSLRGGGSCAQIGIDAGMSFNSYTYDGNDTHKITFIKMGNIGNDAILTVLVDLYKRGKFPFDALNAYYSFDNFFQAWDDSINHRVVKPVIVFD